MSWLKINELTLMSEKPSTFDKKNSEQTIFKNFILLIQFDSLLQ